MKNKKTIIIICIISIILIIFGISISLFINKSKKSNSKPPEKETKEETKKQSVEENKKDAEEVILSSNAGLNKENLTFISNNGNIYTYNYKVDNETAIVTYEVDVSKGTYTVVIGQITKSE